MQTTKNQEIMQQLNALLDSVSQEENTPLPDFSPETMSKLYAMAYELYRNGKYKDAKQFFRFLTIAHPFERRFWMGLGASNQMLKEYQPAIECYSVAAVQESTDPFVHLYATECFLAMDRIQEALKALDSAIEMAKQSPDRQEIVEKLMLMQQAWNAKKADQEVSS